MRFPRSDSPDRAAAPLRSHGTYTGLVLAIRHHFWNSFKEAKFNFVAHTAGGPGLTWTGNACNLHRSAQTCGRHNNLMNCHLNRKIPMLESLVKVSLSRPFLLKVRSHYIEVTQTTTDQPQHCSYFSKSGIRKRNSSSWQARLSRTSLS